MYGQSIGTKDAFVWVEELDDDQIGLSVFCEKLLTLLEENEDRAYSLMAVLLDQAIGEIPAIRYIGSVSYTHLPWHGVFPDRGIYAAGGLPVRMVLRSLKMHPNTIFIRIRPG